MFLKLFKIDPISNPITTHRVHGEGETECNTAVYHSPDFPKDNDKVWVRMDMDRPTEEDAMKMIVSAGIDRNVIVYDSSAEDEPTPRLIALMNAFAKREYTHFTPTDLFIADDVELFIDPARYKFNIHTLDRPSYDKIVSFYKDNLKGTLAAGDEDLVIMVDNSNDNFLIPTDGEKYNIVVISNKNIVLGSY